MAEPATVLADAALVDKAGLTLPVSMRLAKDLGLNGEPLTVDDFRRQMATTGADGATRQGVRSFERLESSGQRRGRPSSEPVASFQDVSYRYPSGTQALKGLSFEVRPGEVHALVGGNGAGKSTALDLLVGLRQPDSGRIVINGADLAEIPVTEVAGIVAAAVQNPDEQITERSAAREITFPLRQRRYEKAGWFAKRERFGDDHIARRLDEVVDLVGLDRDFLDCDARLLPKGQRKLVTLAEALVLDPMAVALDEPSAGLDARFTLMLHRLINELRDRGKAVILADHNTNLIAEVADTVTIMHRGETVAQGPIDEVLWPGNWERLSEVGVDPPRVGELAAALDLTAITYADLAAAAMGRER
jgi:ABC-type multidrug transport system ATPase subunit